MSTTTSFGARNRSVSGPSVAKLVKHFELLSSSTSSLILRGTTAKDRVAGRAGGAGGAGGAGEAGAGKRGPVAKPPQPCDDHKDVRIHSAHVCGTRQQKPSGHRGSGDEGRGRNHLHSVANSSRGGLQTPAVRFYDQRGIEYASPETRQAYRRRHYSLSDADNVTASASATKTTTTSVHRGTSTRVVVVAVHAGGSEDTNIAAAAVDVGNTNSATTTAVVSRQLRVEIELDDLI